MEGVLTEAHTTFMAQKATPQNSQGEEANGGHPNGGPYNIHSPYGHLLKQSRQGRRMEGILKNAHTAFTAHKATSHANNTGQRKKEGTVSMGGERQKRLILGAGVRLTHG